MQQKTQQMFVKVCIILLFVVVLVLTIVAVREDTGDTIKVCDEYEIKSTIHHTPVYMYMDGVGMTISHYVDTPGEIRTCSKFHYKTITKEQ